MDMISVIVPVYNVATYLEGCLESIINQTYQNLEIILVNDGSSDDSLKICEKYRSRDSRIKVITQKNHGLSAARNAGIEMATGKFLTFVDSDDWYSNKDSLKTLYNLLKSKNTEVAIGNFDEFNTKKNVFLLYDHDENSYIFSTKEWFSHQYQAPQHFGQCFSTAWGKLFYSSLFQHLRFPVGKIGEDDLTIWKAYLMTNKIAFLDKNIYTYRNNRDDSITTKENPAHLFSLSAIEQRISTEKIIGFTDVIPSEMKSYYWRLLVHQGNALKYSELSDFKKAQENIKIINKYS